MKPKDKSSSSGLVPIIVGAILIAYFSIASRAKPLWVDEVFTWQLSSADSWREFLRLYATLENNPPLYYVINNLIFRALPHSDLILRIQSLFWALALIWALWKLGRKFFTPYAVSVALVLICIASPVLLFVVEARAYTFLCFAVANGLIALSDIADKEHVGRNNLFKMFGAFVLINYTHALGFVYSTLLLFGLVLFRVLLRKAVRSIILVGGAGIASTSLWFPLISSTLNGTVPVESMPGPMKAYLQLQMQTDWQPYLGLLIGISVVTPFILKKRAAAAGIAEVGPDMRCLMILCVCVIFFIPSLLFASIAFSRPTFWPRYFMGILPAYFVFSAWFADLCFRGSRWAFRPRSVRSAAFCLYLFCSIYPSFAKSDLYFSGPSSADLMMSKHPVDLIRPKGSQESLLTLSKLTIAITNSQMAAQLRHYSPWRDQFLLCKNLNQVEKIAFAVKQEVTSVASSHFLILSPVDQDIQPFDATVFKVEKVGVISFPHSQPYAVVHEVQVLAGRHADER